MDSKVNKFIVIYTVFIFYIIITPTTQAETVKLLVKNAWIVPVDGTGKTYKHGYLTVNNKGIITSIASGQPPESIKSFVELDVKGKIIMPGFISGHSHFIQSPFRGIAHDKNLLDWILGFHRTYEPFYGKDDFYAYALHGGLDLIRHGITTAYDWTANNRNYPLDIYLQQYHGAIDSGIKLLFGFALDLKKSKKKNRRLLSQYLIFLKKENNPRDLGPWMAGLGTLVGAQKAMKELELAKEFNLPIQLHYLEDPDPEWTRAQQLLFSTFDNNNMLSPKLNFAHFIHTNDEILNKTAGNGATMIWNPLSNGRLASGLADIPKYIDKGIKVGMGVDGQASADLADPFENMRMGLYSIRMNYQQADILSPLDMLRLHTIKTAEVLGVSDKVGSLEIGKYADFIVLDPDKIPTSPIINIFAHVVFSCSVANIEQVYINGELLVNKGRLQQYDYNAIKEDINKRVAKVKKQVSLQQKNGSTSLMTKKAFE